MATATASLNHKYQSRNGYQVGIFMVNGKKQKFHKSGYSITEKYWDADREEVKDSHPDADIINSILESDLATAKRYFRDCRLSNTPIDLELVFKSVKSHSWTAYLTYRAGQHKAADQPEMYFKCSRYALEFIRCFGREVYFSDLTPDNIRKFDAWLERPDAEIKKKRNGANTRKKKFEFLAKYWNNAKDDGKTFEHKNPFSSYYIQATPVKKPKLTKEEIKAIEDLPLKKGLVQLARDIFLFSYYCKGIRFETCITSKKTDIAGGRIYFHTNKGQKHISVLIHPRLQQIIDRYIDNDTDTIFGRLSTGDITSKFVKKKLIGSENTLINDRLKDVAELAEIPHALSMHYSRHTFAFHLKKVSNNIHVIKESLGHTKTTTTERYLQELDDEAIDDQVAKVYEQI